MKVINLNINSTAYATVTDCVTRDVGGNYIWGRGTFVCDQEIPSGTTLYALAPDDLRVMIHAQAAAYELPNDARIERCEQADGRHKWAVRRGLMCLSRDGEFEMEPSPSGRDVAFLERCRFASAVEAYKVWECWRTPAPSIAIGTGE